MADIRSKAGVPVIGDFASPLGSVIVINQTTGDLSVLKTGDVIQTTALAGGSATQAFAASTFTGAGTGLTGTAAGLTSGNATKLATPRNISGVAFDGSANITLLDQVLHVREEQPSATAGGSSVAGNQVRVLNTVTRNTIAGASLASNQITLPTGTYKINARAPALRVASHKIQLINVTDSITTIVGATAYSASTDVTQTDATLTGIFIIAAAKVFNITHYTELAAATNGLGLGSTLASVIEVHTSVLIEKIG